MLSPVLEPAVAPLAPSGDTGSECGLHPKVEVKISGIAVGSHPHQLNILLFLCHKSIQDDR